MTTKILKIDSSARTEGSVSRQLTQSITERLSAQGPVDLTTRDLSSGVPFIDGTWIGANFTPEGDRNAAQLDALETSNALVDELKAADIVVIGLAMYNFSVPAVLKAWIDQITRAGQTFRYTENGPEGLLEGKRAVVAVATGGTQAGSEIDFATGYIEFILGFVGIKDVTFVNADRLMVDQDAAMKAAAERVEALRLVA
ncbi:MAG: NAD(P)H-dependent oxidoreductase [Pseudomonadota bacterium]